MAKKRFPGLNQIPGAIRKINEKSYTIRVRVAETLQSYKSIRKAERQTYLDYKNSIKSKSKNYTPWNKELRNGKIYVFRYDPKLADELDFYDKNPVILSLGQKKIKDGFLDLGINLNFLPLRFKLSLLEQIENDKLSIKISDKIKGKQNNNSKLQKPLLHIDYEWSKRYLKHIGFEFAIRSYYIDRRSFCYEVSYEEWENISLLNIVDMEKLNINQVKNLFLKYYKENKN